MIPDNVKAVFWQQVATLLPVLNLLLISFLTLRIAAMKEREKAAAIANQKRDAERAKILTAVEKLAAEKDVKNGA